MYRITGCIYASALLFLFAMPSFSYGQTASIESFTQSVAGVDNEVVFDNGDSLKSTWTVDLTAPTGGIEYYAFTVTIWYENDAGPTKVEDTQVLVFPGDTDTHDLSGTFTGDAGEGTHIATIYIKDDMGFVITSSDDGSFDPN